MAPNPAIRYISDFLALILRSHTVKSEDAASIRGVGDLGRALMLMPKKDCPFCITDSSREIILETELAISIFDKFPVNNGHALIIPKRHVSNYFDLTIEEQKACFQLVNKVKDVLSKKFNPDGYNIGINIGEKAGQTVNHVHIHLIPRYKGDVENPRGGVRGVIPSKQSY